MERARQLRAAAAMTVLESKDVVRRAQKLLDRMQNARPQREPSNRVENGHSLLQNLSSR